MTRRRRRVALLYVRFRARYTVVMIKYRANHLLTIFLLYSVGFTLGGSKLILCRLWRLSYTQVCGFTCVLGVGRCVQGVTVVSSSQLV